MVTLEPPLVLVHGGAGARPADAGPMAEGCRRAAEAGVAVLHAGGSVLDAVVAAVAVLEDDPWFNAGTGAALREDGSVSLDAAVVVGDGLLAGGVAALPPFRHPIEVARAVLAEGRHVLYVGEAAARWAEEAGFERLPADALTTERSRARLAQQRTGRTGELPSALDTVGAVAVDARGRVAAGTSTGGVVGARPGRVGDSPIPGAGCSADDEAGACSTTGEGEAILRVGLAHDAIARLAGGADPQGAADAAVARLGERTGGLGGCIVVAPDGRIGVARNTPGMPWAAADGRRTIDGP